MRFPPLEVIRGSPLKQTALFVSVSRCFTVDIFFTPQKTGWQYILKKVGSGTAETRKALYFKV
jgi:hypothetical protein